jgi:hypothetical protein
LVAAREAPTSTKSCTTAKCPPLVENEESKESSNEKSDGTVATECTD